MSGHGEKLSRKQDLAVAALLTSPTLAEAAELAGVAPVTLRRWAQHAAFQAACRDARRAVVAQAVSHMQQACGQAVETLRAIMADVQAPASARVSASRTVLEMVMKAEEIAQLEQRILEMETRIMEREKH